MNVMDILSELDHRPLRDYPWGELLVSQINNVAKSRIATVDTTGQEALDVIENLSPSKRLTLYEIQMPPMKGQTAGMNEDQEDKPSSSLNDSPPVNSGESNKAFTTAISIGTIFIVMGLVVIALGVTGLTTDPDADTGILSKIFKVLSEFVLIAIGG